MEEERILSYGNHTKILINQRRYTTYKKINGINAISGEPILIPEGTNYIKDSEYDEYVPLFAIPGFDAQPTNHNNTIFYEYFTSRRTPVHNKISSLLLGREENGKLVVDKVSRLFMEHLDDPTLFKVSDFIKEAINNPLFGGSTYSSLMNSQSNLFFSNTRLRSNSYISGYYTLLTKEGDFIWTLAVRKEHVKYVKLCFMLGKDIDPRVLVFMAQTGFNSRTTFNKPLRSHFRKQMREWLDHHSVKFVDMDFKSKFTGFVDIPEDISTLSEIEEWERNTVDEFLNSLNVAIALKKDNIELINDIE